MGDTTLITKDEALRLVIQNTWAKYSKESDEV